MSNMLTRYKLTILYMLDRASIPLSNTQIANFFLEKEYTDYFNVQNVLSELQELCMIIPRYTYHNTQYLLSVPGKNILQRLADNLPSGMRADVDDFLSQNQIQFREENSVVANYYQTTGGKYAAHCQVFSDGQPSLDLTVSVPEKRQAETICRNWDSQNQEVYAAVMDLLLQ